MALTHNTHTTHNSRTLRLTNIFGQHKVITCLSVFPFEKEKCSTQVWKSVIECLTSSNIIIYNWGRDWIFNIIRDWEAFDTLKYVFFLSVQKWVPQPCLKLTFGVGYYACLNPTKDANVTSPAVFWPRYRGQNFWNYFFYMKYAQCQK